MAAGVSSWRTCLAAIMLNATATRGLVGVTMCEDAVGASFQAPPNEQVWLAEAFMVASTCALLVTPWLLHRLGQRRLLLLCTAGFVLALVGGYQSRSLGQLVACLFLQGLATAPLLPLTQTMLANRLPEARRNLAMVVWNSGNVAGAIVGSAAAGLALRWGDWHLLFWMGLPFLVAGVVLAGSDDGPPRREEALDLRGLGLLTVGTVALTVGLNLAPGLRPGSPLWGLLAVGPACLAGYWGHARRHPQPLLDLRPLLVPSCAAALGLSLAFNAVSSGQLEANFLLSQMHAPSWVMMLRTLLYSGSALAGVALGGLPLDGLLVGSLLVTLAGRTGYLLYTPDQSAFMALWPSAVSTLGYWMVATLLSILLLQRIEASLRPAATALYALSAQLGGTLGVAILDGLFASAGRRATVERAFAGVFWIEWLGVVLLLVAVLRLRRSTHRGA